MQKIPPNNPDLCNSLRLIINPFEDLVPMRDDDEALQGLQPCDSIVTIAIKPATIQNKVLNNKTTFIMSLIGFSFYRTGRYLVEKAHGCTTSNK